MKTLLRKVIVPDLEMGVVKVQITNKGFTAIYDAEIITPPTEEEIEYQSFHDSTRAGKFERGVNWTLKYLGL